MYCFSNGSIFTRNGFRVKCDGSDSLSQWPGPFGRKDIRKYFDKKVLTFFFDMKNMIKFVLIQISLSDITEFCFKGGV